MTLTTGLFPGSDAPLALIGQPVLDAITDAIAESAPLECSSLGGNRARLPEDDSLVAVNTFLNPDWGCRSGRR